MKITEGKKRNYLGIAQNKTAFTISYISSTSIYNFLKVHLQT